MRQKFAWCTILFLTAVALALAGCAQKQPSATEAEQQERPFQEEEAAEEDTQAEEEQKQEEEVEEYEVSQEESAQKEEAEEREKERKVSREEALGTLKKRIHFAFDSSELSEEAQEKLKQKAQVLKEYSDLRVVIEGHCDERGTDEYNMALGERRARAAYEYLVLLGVGADRMEMVSYGEERPLVEGHDESAWAKNRRAEFRIKE